MREVERTDEVHFRGEWKRLIDAAQPTRLDEILLPYLPKRVLSRMETRTEVAKRRVMLAYAAANPPGGSYQRQVVVGPLRSEDAELPGFDRFQIILDARDQYRNNGIIRSGVNGVARRAVATGISPIWDTGDERWDEETREAWLAWAEAPEITGRFDMDGICRQMIRSTFVDGDLGIQYLDIDNELRLQLIEGDLIAENNRVNIGQDTINPIGGVVVDWKTMRVLGYMVGQRGVGGLLVNSEFVSADEFALLYRAQRVDQFRGVPLLAPVLQTARDLDRYMTATRLQANIAASFGVIIKRDLPAQFAMQASEASSDGDRRTMPFQSGQVMTMHPGESIETINPTVPSSVFDPFSKFMVRLIAVGMGSCYEFLMQDYSDMSFATSRVTLMDMTLTMREWQRWVWGKGVRPSTAVWLAKSMETGRIPYNSRAYSGMHAQFPAELGIDPQRDANADIQRLATGLDTMSNLYEQEGRRFKSNLRKRIKEIKFIIEECKREKVDPKMVSTSLELAPEVVGTAAPSPGSNGNGTRATAPAKGPSDEGGRAPGRPTATDAARGAYRVRRK